MGLTREIGTATFGTRLCLDFGTTNSQVREKALSENLSLEELIKKGQGIESSNQFESSIRCKQEVYAVFRGNGRGGFTRTSGGDSKSDRSCFKCVGRFPHLRNCPAKDNQCQICRRFGHFKAYCNQKQRSKKGGQDGYSGFRKLPGQPSES